MDVSVRYSSEPRFGQKYQLHNAGTSWAHITDTPSINCPQEGLDFYDLL